MRKSQWILDLRRSLDWDLLVLLQFTSIGKCNILVMFKTRCPVKVTTSVKSPNCRHLAQQIRVNRSHESAWCYSFRLGLCTIQYSRLLTLERSHPRGFCPDSFKYYYECTTPLQVAGPACKAIPVESGPFPFAIYLACYLYAVYYYS